MTQKTKLEIIGPYTPEHEGPFCTRDGKPVEIKIRDGRGNYPLRGYIGESTQIVSWLPTGHYIMGDHTDRTDDLMNAREVPVTREFWVNKYNFRELSAAYPTKGMADSFAGRDRVECIHVREVLPGEE